MQSEPIFGAWSILPGLRDLANGTRAFRGIGRDDAAVRRTDADQASVLAGNRNDDTSAAICGRPAVNVPCARRRHAPPIDSVSDSSETPSRSVLDDRALAVARYDSWLDNGRLHGVLGLSPAVEQADNY
jgi:hypothetical protein